MIEKMLFPTDFSSYSLIITEFLEDLKEAGVKETGILFVVNTEKLSTVAGGFEPMKYVEIEERRANS